MPGLHPRPYESLSIDTATGPVKPAQQRNRREGWPYRLLMAVESPRMNDPDLQNVPQADLQESRPLPQTPRGHDATWVFTGADGLRAGWGILLFLLFLITLAPFSAQRAVKFVAQHVPGSEADPAARQAHELHPEGVAETTAAEGTEFAVVLCGTVILAVLERRRFTAYGLGGGRRITHFLLGLLCGAACLSLLIAALRLSGAIVFDPRQLSGLPALRYAALWGVAFIAVALFEELSLRGYLQYTLARGLAAIYGAVFKTRHRHALGFWTAALILSFVFGIGHGSNPGESPVGLLTAGLAGLLFCLSLYRTGALWWALGFHAAWDWAQSFLYGTADSGLTVEGHLFAAHPVGKPILSGGLTGPEGSLLVLPVLALAAGVIFLTLPRTHRPGAGLSHPDGA